MKAQKNKFILTYTIILRLFSLATNAAPASILTIARSTDLGARNLEESYKRLQTRDQRISDYRRYQNARRQDDGRMEDDLPFDHVEDDEAFGNVRDDKLWEPETKNDVIYGHWKWLRPTKFAEQSPHQWFKCDRRSLDDPATLHNQEINELARFMIWKYRNSDIAFHNSGETECMPVYCHAPFSMVTICNRRPDPVQNPLTITAREVGRLAWEMSVFTKLDTQWLSYKLEEDGIERPCKEGGSNDNRDPGKGGFIAETGWSEDQWDVMLSRRDCLAPENRYPNMMIDEGQVPGTFPQTFYDGIDFEFKEA